MEIDVVTVEKKIKRRFQHVWGDRNNINIPGLEAIGELARLLEGQPFPDLAGLEAIVNALINTESYKHREEIQRDVFDAEIVENPIQLPRKRGRPPGKSNAVKHTHMPSAPPPLIILGDKRKRQKNSKFMDYTDPADDSQTHTYTPAQRKELRDQEKEREKKARLEFLDRNGIGKVGRPRTQGQSYEQSDLYHQYGNVSYLEPKRTTPLPAPKKAKISINYQPRSDDALSAFSSIPQSSYARAYQSQSGLFVSAPRRYSLPKIDTQARRELKASHLANLVTTIETNYKDISPIMTNALSDIAAKFVNRSIDSLACASMLQCLFKDKPKIIHEALEAWVKEFHTDQVVEVPPDDHISRYVHNTFAPVKATGSDSRFHLMSMQPQSLQSSSQYSKNNHISEDNCDKNNRNTGQHSNVASLLTSLKESLSGEDYSRLLHSILKIRDCHNDGKVDEIASHKQQILSYIPASKKELLENLIHAFRSMTSQGNASSTQQDTNDAKTYPAQATINDDNHDIIINTTSSPNITVRA